MSNSYFDLVLSISSDTVGISECETCNGKLIKKSLYPRKNVLEGLDLNHH